MELESLDLQSATYAWIILTFIPVVVFAIWSDHFERGLVALKQAASPEVDQEEIKWELEKEKVQLSGLLVLLAEFIIYIQFPEVTKDSPFLTLSILSLALFGQTFLQSSLISKIDRLSHPETPSKRFSLPLPIRALIAWSSAILIYVGVLLMSIRIAVFVGVWVHASTLSYGILLVVSSAIGTWIGLILNYGLAPLQFRKVLPVDALKEEDPRHQLIKRYFKLSRINLPQLWVIHLESIPMNQVFLLGFLKGKGLLRPGLFIPSHLFTLLEPRELRALILNQISHILLAHFSKRIWLAIGLMIGTGSLILFTLFVGIVAFNDMKILALIGPILAVASLFFSFKQLMNQFKEHELEADLFTIQTLSVRKADLISMIRKTELTFEGAEGSKRIQAILGVLPDQAEPDNNKQKAA